MVGATVVVGQTATPPQSAPEPATSQASDVPAMPSIDELVYLIRNMTIAVNHANLTNNYTVLWGLGTPEFQQRNPAPALAQRFAAIRENNFDFGVTLAIPPQFSTAPTIDATGMLRLTGYFPTAPRVTFDFGFRQDANHWKPLALGIGIVPVEQTVPLPSFASPKLSGSDAGSRGQKPVSK